MYLLATVQNVIMHVALFHRLLLFFFSSCCTFFSNASWVPQSHPISLFKKKNKTKKNQNKNSTFNRPGVNFLYENVEPKSSLQMLCLWTMVEGKRGREKEVCVCRKRSLFVGHWNGQSTNKNQKCDVLSFFRNTYVIFMGRPCET